jgi:hypothetical protein
MRTSLKRGRAFTSPCMGLVGALRGVGVYRRARATPSLTLPLSGGGN